MGAGLVRRLMRDGHRCVVYDVSPDAIKALEAEGADGATTLQMLGGPTLTGRKAQLAWGAVHLALLPTNEDRAKAVVDWAGTELTHQRVGRITVGSE